MKIGNTIMTLRMENGISRPEMAKRLGITPSALWKIEAGKTAPKSSTLKKFCETLSIPLAYLYVHSLEQEDFIAQ